MSAGDLVAGNAKAVVSALGGVVNVLLSATALNHYASTPVAGIGAAVLAALEVLRTVNVWIVRNEPLIRAAATAGAELVTSLETPAPPGTA